MENSLNVFPNPFSSQVNIELPSVVKNLQIEILNFSGELVQRTGKIENNRITVDMSQYPTGIYFLKVSNGDAFVVKKISLIK
jgi:hypothetical protein